ncbi:MAG: riboflavin synthase [Candidatus Pelagibacter sp. TMED64]|nr:riboflavin synthase [Candidatus Pelagibacter sp.]OUU64899.1 MAG: riboflavin synthase [Candidatus Pelagibacter sp. TMED64]
MEIFILTNYRVYKKDIGESFSCSGVCLTLTNFINNCLIFYISNETLKVSNFSRVKKNDIINIERPMKFGESISGHFVQGHVDSIARIKNIKILGKSWIIIFKISKKFIKYIVKKGSISINGVSLTVSNFTKDTFEITVIPHTLKMTNLIKLKKNDIVNVEFDILAKYVMKVLK